MQVYVLLEPYRPPAERGVFWVPLTYHHGTPGEIPCDEVRESWLPSMAQGGDGLWPKVAHMSGSRWMDA